MQLGSTQEYARKHAPEYTRKYTDDLHRRTGKGPGA
jgi:hypothetical protein